MGSLVGIRHRNAARLLETRPRGAWRVVLPIVAMAATLALPTPVAAVSVVLDPASGFPGASVNAIGSDFPPNTPIAILWDGAVIKSAADSGAAERFRIEFRVPGGAIPGPHVVTMCATSANSTACTSEQDGATFTVVLPASPTPTAEPVRTQPASPPPAAQSSPLPLLLIVAVVGAIGGGLYWMRTRRTATGAKPKPPATARAWRERPR